MGQSSWPTIQKVYRERGISGVAAQTFKKIVRPVARAGSMYFLQRDLRLPMPPLEPNLTLVAREGTLSDVHLLDAMPNPERHKRQAIERLMGGDHWFIGIDKSTGKLANHRWVSLRRAFIPELNRDLIVRPSQAYVYDLETTPEFRRRGIEATTRQFTYDVLHQQYGVNDIVAYILGDNYASLRAARHYLTIICRVWFIRIGQSIYMFSRENRNMPELKPAYCLKHQAALRARPSNSLR